ncbi:ABC transporter ATP-binding protein [Carnobacteriaceae bacterium zg-ZUI78]|nr:ABC transporter ATP-binding protein [Carnobacteriaceae bacterium zg-ZUI78]
MNSIQVKNIKKHFGKSIVLENVSMTFQEDKIYALLGRNGAGKSTLMKIITNQLFADEGTVLLDNEVLTENANVLKDVYIMSAEATFPKDMKVKEILHWTQQFHLNFDKEKALKHAELFGLPLKKKVSKLSTGYQTILKLVLAMNNHVPYVIYDEPILGLDANHRELFYKLLLQGYEDRPHTIIIATHLIEEIAHVVEHVVIIDKGRVLLDEDVDTLLERGYSISGNAQDVQQYAAGKNVLDIDTIGALSVAYILGTVEDDLPETLTVSAINLQKIFVKLTDKGVV